jgi:hypothetical protein
MGIDQARNDELASNVNALFLWIASEQRGCFIDCYDPVSLDGERSIVDDFAFCVHSDEGGVCEKHSSSLLFPTMKIADAIVTRNMERT